MGYHPICKHFSYARHCIQQIREQNRAAAAEAEKRKERQRKAGEEKRRAAEARRVKLEVSALTWSPSRSYSTCQDCRGLLVI